MDIFESFFGGHNESEFPDMKYAHLDPYKYVDYTEFPARMECQCGYHCSVKDERTMWRAIHRHNAKDGEHLLFPIN